MPGASGSLEIEGKYRVDCAELESIAARAEELGGRFLGARSEEDVYYQHPCRDFASTDEALRLRYVQGRVESLTYKGPKMPGRVKARLELILSPLGGPVEQVLERLGFTPVARVVKRRRYYRLGDSLVTLDEVEGLGCFVEVEAPTTSRVEEVAGSLGLEGPPIVESYLEMLLARAEQGGSSGRGPSG
ncbi:MAG: class IV adenylate cyclase [Desulfurococcales archaeon]|nr:class IV adenylate cyclase [Desulfurococcales archaeon]